MGVASHRASIDRKAIKTKCLSNSMDVKATSGPTATSAIGSDAMPFSQDVAWDRALSDQRAMGTGAEYTMDVKAT